MSENIKSEFNVGSSKRKTLYDFLTILFASVLYGIGIGSFLDPNNLAPGGVTGIAIIINRLTGIETGTLSFIMNIPLILIGVWKFGGRFLLSTIVAIGLTSTSINVFLSLPKASSDVLISAIAGGFLVALSVGMIFKAGATTGGTDIIVRLVKLRYKHLKTGVVFMATDIFVVTLSAIVFRNIDRALYAAICVVVCSIVLDMVLYGKDEAKLLYIIGKSQETEKMVAKKFLEDLDVGVTQLYGIGAYSNHTRKVIFCAIRKQQLPLAKEIVKEIDEDAFMIVTSANEILGEGYKSHHSINL